MFWYNDEVNLLAGKKVIPKGKKLRLVCYGSSSMRLWVDVAEDFPEFDVVNVAFGGSTLAACCWFFERLIPQLNPDVILFYAGDNDLGDKRHPEEVFLFFTAFMEKVKIHFGNIPVGFISIKPSFARDYLIESIKYTNKIIKEEIEKRYSNCTFINVFDEMHTVNQIGKDLYEEDGLHMSKAGYEIWEKIVRKSFLEQFVTI